MLNAMKCFQYGGFGSMIEIKGEKIILRTWNIETYKAMWKKYVNDPLMDPVPYKYNEEKVLSWYHINMSMHTTYPRFGIFDKEDNPIGELSLKRIDYANRTCEIGIMLANDTYKSKGYGSEAFSLAIKYAFNVLGLRKIFGDTFSPNIKSQKLFLKNGFQLYKVEKDSVEREDGMWDKLYYVLERQQRRRKRNWYL
ncbi:MAG: N-acetyltransferase [Clostridiales bacterium]|jgi:RimJ/RimL family protein N-acetyltransferase|nr:N-acetyltransferase [Clostridiales bacterium]